MLIIDSNLVSSNEYNIGPLLNDNLTVKDIVEISIEKLGYGNYEILQQTNQLHEAKQLRLDISKAMNELNWKPIWNAKIAIEKTMDWYANYKTTHSQILTNNQIDEYLQLI